jgi:hypothetical protein
MIKIFRKNRIKFLNKDKIGKYLLYAIGEILLVVIGILIALQINNWNEDRKRNEELGAIYELVISDLESDLMVIPDKIKYNKDKEPLLKHVLNGELVADDYLNNPKYYNLIGGFEDFTLKTKGYEQLRDFNNNGISKTELHLMVNDFYEYFNSRLQGLNEIAFDDVKSNYKFWKENHSWYADYIMNKNPEDFISYTLENPDYRNRVANYYLSNNELLSKTLEELKTGGESILKILKENRSDSYDQREIGNHK